MDSVRESPDELIIETSTAPIVRLVGLIAAGCGTWIAAGVLRDPAFVRQERFFGLLVGGAFAALFALVASERGVFVFDRRRRLLTWRRRWALSRRSGSIPFEAIESVVVQTPLGDEGVPSRRAVLVTRGGEVPIMLGYKADPDDACVRLVGRIQSFLRGPETRPAPEEDVLLDSARAAARAGRTVEAIALVRRQRGLSLEQARELVESWRADQDS